ncbi:MAG: hypothetical protein DRQ52_02915 [Gammaproteobacteria bacterium]|nr:MAG: hypothetical protein DRQ52_02915 [Gammaproteobacteria bacterium]
MLFWGVTLLVSLSLLLGVAIYLYGKDHNYRDGLIWAVDYVYDTQLEIDGDFLLEVGKEVRITADGVRLRDNDGRWKVLIGKVNGRERLFSFFRTGSWWLPEINLSDVRVDVFESDNDEALDWRRFYLPELVVEKLRLRNAVVTYTNSEKQSYEIKLQHLSLDEAQDRGSIKLSAAGEVNGDSFNLEGTLGTLSQLRVVSEDKSKAYPIELSLTRGAAESSPAGKKSDSVIKVKGSIARTPRHSTIVEATYDAAVSELVTVFSKDVTSSGLGHLQGNVSIVDVGDSWEIKKFALASSDTTLYQLRADLAVDDSKKDDQLLFQSQLGVPDPAALGAQLGIDFRGYSSFHSKGMLSGDLNHLSYQSKATLGNTEIDMTLTASIKDDKPSIEGKITIPELDLADIGFAQGLDAKVDALAAARSDTNQPSKPEAGPGTAHRDVVFSRKPVNFSRLQSFNLDMDLLVEKVVRMGYSVNSIAGHVDLTNGVLKVIPMQLMFEGGETGIEIEVDVRDTPKITIKGQSNGLLLGAILAEVDQDSGVRGDLVLNIKSRGHSVHQLAAGLSGTANFSLENARFPQKYVEYLSVDVFGWLLMKGSLGAGYSKIDCAMIDFDINQGIAKSKLLIVDGPSVFVEGAATIDLGLETIEMLLKPEQKKEIFSKMSAVRITGSLADPTVKALPLTAASTGVLKVGAVVLLPIVAIPATMLDELWGRRNTKDQPNQGCAGFIARQKAKEGQ